MELHFIFWSIASVYISMLTSCLTLQNTANPIQAWLAGSSQISTITANQTGSESSDFLICFKSILHQNLSLFIVIFTTHFFGFLTQLWSSCNACVMILVDGKSWTEWCLTYSLTYCFLLKHSHYFQLLSFEDFCFLSTLDNCRLNTVSFVPVCLTKSNVKLSSRTLGYADSHY